MINFKHRDVMITVTAADGLFMANVEDVKVAETSLQAAKDKIDRLLTSKAKAKVISIPVVGLVIDESSRWGRGDDSSGRSIGRATLVGVNRTTNTLMFRGLPKDTSINWVLPDMPEAEAILKEKLAADAEGNRLKSALDAMTISSRGCGRIDPEDYDKLISAIEEQAVAAKVKLKVYSKTRT